MCKLFSLDGESPYISDVRCHIGAKRGIRPRRHFFPESFSLATPSGRPAVIAATIMIHFRGRRAVYRDRWAPERNRADQTWRAGCRRNYRLRIGLIRTGETAESRRWDGWEGERRGNAISSGNRSLRRLVCRARRIDRRRVYIRGAVSKIPPSLPPAPRRLSLLV